MERIFLVAILALAGCADESQAIIVHPAPVVLEARSAGGSVPSAPAIDTRSEAAQIPVLPAKRPDRPAEVVGVVDAHLPVADHERGLAVLRQKAAALGADAVIGVDFAHGEGHAGEPTHLSGLAIRYLDR